MRRLQRYILRQLAGPFAFFLLVLTGVIWLTQSLRFVDLIINKGLSAGYFAQLTLLVLPNVLAMILPIGLFAAILYCYHNLDTDSEIVVMRSAGMGNLALARPALMLALAATVVGYFLSLYLMPTGQRAFKDKKTSLRTNLSYLLLQEGTFNTIGDRLTVYIRARQPGGELLGILVHDSRDRQRPVTMIAEKGALVRSQAGPRFVMVNGNRQQNDHGAGQLSLLQFDRYALDLSQFVRRDDERWLEPSERYLHELFWPGEGADDIANANRMLAEAHDRLAAPLFSLAFAMIALAAVLSGQFSRRGRRWPVLVAVGFVVLVRAGGLGLVNLAAKVPILMPLIYLNIMIAIAICAVMLLKPPRRPGLARIPVAEGT
ncbi:MAG: LPS export ABC transporter permease LptF [Alphaproteobacteria bacterium]|nr:LPS export ABC transporter permease LptF [Alphaproteobacteria bacterium]MDP6813637.1 LPS export ABC transporter permease LptF [Alphaproteobacteria bacterium]